MFELDGQEFSNEEMEEIAAGKNVSLDELLKNNPNIKKTEKQDFQNPTAPGAVVEGNEASNTGLNLENGSSESQKDPKKKEVGFFRGLWNRVSLTLPKALVADAPMQIAGNELQYLAEEEAKLEERFKADGTYSWNQKTSFDPSRGGKINRTSTKGTLKEAKAYYAEKRKGLEKKFVENLVQSSEYQAELDKWESVKIYDEDGNMDLSWSDVKQVTGEQLPQMLAAMFSFGGSTLVQESGGVANDLLNKKSAKEYGFSLEGFMKLPLEEQNKLKTKLVSEGKAEDLFDQALKVGVQNAGMDLFSNFIVIGKATKFLPKGFARNLLKGKIMKPLKTGGAYVGTQAAAQVPEVITENLQEINSAWAGRNDDGKFFGDEYTWNDFKETTAQTIIGTGGTQVSIGGSNFARKEVVANYLAMGDPNAVRSITREAKTKVKNDQSLSEDQKLDLLDELDAAEDTMNNSKYKNLEGEGKRNVYLNLVDSQKAQKEITKLENQDGELNLSDQAKLENAKSKLESFNNNINKEVILNNYRAKGKGLATWVNSQKDGYFADKNVHIKQNKKELTEFLERTDPKALSQENVQKLLNNDGVSGVKFGNNVYILDDNIKANTYKSSLTSTNVAHHEVLHLIMDGVPQDKKSDIKNSILESFKNSEDSEIKLVYEALNERMKPYENKSDNVKTEEFFAGLSDVFRLFDLQNVEQASVLDAVGSLFSKSFSETIPNIGFELNAENTVEFIKKFNDFQGKKTIKEKIVGVSKAVSQNLPKGNVDIKEDEALGSLEKLTPEIQESVSKEIANLKIAKQESLELNKKFGKEGIKTNKEQSIERRITEFIKPTVDSFAESRTKALYDPIAKEAKEPVSREEFRESMKSDINTMVFNEYDPSIQTVEKFITNRGFLRANDLASRLGIKSVEQGIDKKIDDNVTKTIIDDSPVQKESTTTKKINPSKVLSKEQYDNAVDVVVSESKNLDFEKLSFKKLGNITSKITGEISGVPAKKFLNAASNLTKDEVRSGRMFINKNANDTFKTLPQGAVLESDQASERLLGTSTGVPKGILNSPLYVKQARGKKGAGLAAYKLNPNATVQTLLDLIGKPGDPVASRSTEAQNVKSIIKLIDKNITNEIFREKVQLSPQIRADIAAGKSEALASSDVNLQVAKEELYEKSQDVKPLKEDAVEILKSMKFKVGNFDVEYNKAIKNKSIPQGFKGVAIEWYYKTTLNEAFKNDPNVEVNMDIPLMGNSGVDLVIMVGGKPLNIEIKSSYKDQMGSVSYNGPITDLIASSKSDKDLAKKLQFIAADSRKLQKYANRYKELTGEKMDLTYPIKVNKDIDNIIRKEEDGFSLNTMTLTDNVVSMTSHYNSKGVNYIIFHDLDVMLAMGKDPLNFNIPLIDKLGGKINAGPRSTGTNKTTNERNFVNRIIFTLDASKKNTKVIKDLASKGFKMSKPENFVQALKEQGALASADLDLEFNNILEKSTKIESRKRYAKAKAEVAGKGKGKFDLLGIPPSAQDFMGLAYKFIGKGKEGDAQLAWIKTHLTDPFSKAMVDISNARVALANDYKEIKKLSKIAPKDLKKKIPGEPFTVGQAIRVAAWTKQGMEVPGLSKADLKELNKYVNNDPDLKSFADQLIQITKENGYPKPDKNWLAGTISTDLLNGLNTTSRKQALENWQTNADIIFSETNLNKLEAAYGKPYRIALENMLERMKTGTNRKVKGDNLTNRFIDWINGSVGTIMFFNMRSAVLQTISSVNFVNWSDNNPLKAAMAFANQPQYWKDVIKLMNSDYLLERRNGLKINVNEADIAEIAAESNNKAKAFVNKLLKLGFLPTQIADSFAISSGGATFYRNRIKSYIKEGMSIKDAEAQAFLDFREISEESQQSSRPDRISKQQASELGRIILAFANTPSQYARIMQKAGSDLVNRRGDAKTNISKIIYYGAIQNVIFNALQQALFAIAFDEEPEEEEMNKKNVRIVNGMADSLLRGVGFHGAVISMVKNGIMKIADGKPMQDAALEALSISPPVSSKIKKLQSAGRTFDWNKKEIKEKGLSLDNPAFLATGQITSALTNIPLDRGIKKITNIKDALDKENDDWKRVANILGWAKWELEWAKNKKLGYSTQRSSINRQSRKRGSVKRQSIKRN